MVITFCYLCQMSPFIKKHVFHPRATDDMFVMVLEVSDRASEDEAANFLKSLGALEVEAQVAEEGWWLGRYGKATLAYERGQKGVIA